VNRPQLTRIERAATAAQKLAAKIFAGRRPIRGRLRAGGQVRPRDELYLAGKLRPVLDHAWILPLRADRPRQTCLPDTLIGFCRYGAPAGADPPSHGPSATASTLAQRPERPSEGGGRWSLGALLRNTREQGTNLGLPVAPVPPQRAD